MLMLVFNLAIAQVSCNLLDFEQTGLSQVFEAVSEDARALSLPVVGSQLVGLVPLAALLTVAEHYIACENLLVLDEDQKVELFSFSTGVQTRAFRFSISFSVALLIRVGDSKYSF